MAETTTQKNQNSAELVGFYNPTRGSPAFVLPVFTSWPSNPFYIQNVGAKDTIIAFEGTNIPEKLVQSIEKELKAQVDGLAIWGFQETKTGYEIGTKSELIEYLNELLEKPVLFDFPFVNLEVIEFSNRTDLLRAALQAARGKMLVISEAAEGHWRDMIVLTPKLREITEEMISATNDGEDAVWRASLNQLYFTLDKFSQPTVMMPRSLVERLTSKHVSYRDECRSSIAHYLEAFGASAKDVSFKVVGEELPKAVKSPQEAWSLNSHLNPVDIVVTAFGKAVKTVVSIQNTTFPPRSILLKEDVRLYLESETIYGPQHFLLLYTNDLNTPEFRELLEAKPMILQEFFFLIVDAGPIEPFDFRFFTSLEIQGATIFPRQLVQFGDGTRPISIAMRITHYLRTVLMSVSGNDWDNWKVTMSGISLFGVGRADTGVNSAKSGFDKAMLNLSVGSLFFQTFRAIDVVVHSIGDPGTMLSEYSRHTLEDKAETPAQFDWYKRKYIPGTSQKTNVSILAKGGVEEPPDQSRNVNQNIIQIFELLGCEVERGRQESFAIILSGIKYDIHIIMNEENFPGQSIKIGNNVIIVSFCRIVASRQILPFLAEGIYFIDSNRLPMLMGATSEWHLKYTVLTQLNPQHIGGYLRDDISSQLNDIALNNPFQFQLGDALDELSSGTIIQSIEIEEISVTKGRYASELRFMGSVTIYVELNYGGKSDAVMMNDEYPGSFSAVATPLGINVIELTADNSSFYK